MSSLTTFIWFRLSWDATSLLCAASCCNMNFLKIFLFGSKARGEASPSSDVDIVVILDRATAQDLSDSRGLAFDILLDHSVYLSVRAMSRGAWQSLATMRSMFYRNVLRDGTSLVSAAT